MRSKDKGKWGRGRVNRERKGNTVGEREGDRERETKRESERKRKRQRKRNRKKMGEGEMNYQ